jgi:hypothetical protein
LSGLGFRVLAFHLRQGYGGQVCLAFLPLSKPDDPPSLKLRRDRSALVKPSAVELRHADKTANGREGNGHSEKPGLAKIRKRQRNGGFEDSARLHLI